MNRVRGQLHRSRIHGSGEILACSDNGFDDFVTFSNGRAPERESLFEVLKACFGDGEEVGRAGAISDLGINGDVAWGAAADADLVSGAFAFFRVQRLAEGEAHWEGLAEDS